jgi:hypothetical protein
MLAPLVRVRLPILVLCALGLVAGCGGGGPAIGVAQLSKLVLQPGDLPPAFAQFDAGRQVQVDRVQGPRFDNSRYGREDGWKARYNRAGSPATAGPLVVESRADLFKAKSGATTDLLAYREQFKATPNAHLIGVPRIGDESVAMTQLRPGAPAVRFYTVAWRDANVTGSVAVNGFAGKLTLGQALALARAQERHIAAARG